MKDWFLVVGLLVSTWVHGMSEELIIRKPLDLQVVQRDCRNLGLIPVEAEWQSSKSIPSRLKFRFSSPDQRGFWEWTNLAHEDNRAVCVLELPSGGWYDLELEFWNASLPVSSVLSVRVGVGDVFVVAGQSNSANHGEERLVPESGRVACFDGKSWRLAVDPQAGASGNGGSFIPAFGDELVKSLGVPVGIVACGVGATSVREWLPEGSRFPNPPTLTGNVRSLASGEWESRGDLFRSLTQRMKLLGSNGFRAVLWHQGESDANQKDPTRTLAGSLYYDSMKVLIERSRAEAGWNVPWFVALASYHTPDDPGSEEIRDAQRALWNGSLALEGPDSDALTGDLRDNGGQGVHFSGKGLRAHGKLWAQKVLKGMISLKPGGDEH